MPAPRRTGVHPSVPDPGELPESILQFGTGVFLRGFADVFVDDANRDGPRPGRIVAVGSTGSGRVAAINENLGQYTVSFRGIEAGDVVDRLRLVRSISRALSAGEQWDDVLEVARSRDLRFAISNTTEVGIWFDPEDRPDLHPPRSFPGKLTAVLRERATEFDFDVDTCLTILCCELIEDNGAALKSVVLTLADRWNLGAACIEWIGSCRFCNTLVDRIVSGRPTDSRIAECEALLGRHDPLLIEAEPYALWAIEGDDSLWADLPFRREEPAIVVTPDIAPYRQRKVRILNGGHTAMVGISYLCGNDTVAESMQDPQIGRFISSAVLDEIVPSLNLDQDEARRFARQVLDRFCNPFVRHELRSIALHHTSKMDLRLVPSIVSYHTLHGILPRGLTFAFAAFLVFVLKEQRAAAAHLPTDERAETIREHAASSDDTGTFVRAVLHDDSLWSLPIVNVSGLAVAIADFVTDIRAAGARPALQTFLHAAPDDARA